MPKITLNIYDKRGKRYTHSSYSARTVFFHFISLAKKATRGYVEVYYGQDKGERVTNGINVKDFSDIKWAMDAFLDNYLFLKRGELNT